MHAGFYSDFNPNTVLPAPTYTSPGPCAVALTAQGWVAPDPASGPRCSCRDPSKASRRPRRSPAWPTGARTPKRIVIRRAETGPTIPWTAGERQQPLHPDRALPGRCGQFVSRRPRSEPQDLQLAPPNCTSGTATMPLRRLLQRTYYVATCNDCANNDGIPTLKRVEMIDGALLTTSIAEGVENLQFEFGVDTAATAVPDATCHGRSSVPAADWPNVVSVRMHVLTRSERPVAGLRGRTHLPVGAECRARPRRRLQAHAARRRRCD